LDRVAKLIVDFGRHLGLGEKQMKVLENSAELHDIGKIGVRDELLRKKTPLTKEETDELKHHVIIGENIIRPIKMLAPLCRVVRHHQERYDGTGYPDGLKGKEIPLEARILKIADAFDAMIINRPYRKAMSRQEAVQQLKKNKGTEFDPGLVDKFLEIV